MKKVVALLIVMIISTSIGYADEEFDTTFDMDAIKDIAVIKYKLDSGRVGEEKLSRPPLRGYLTADKSIIEQKDRENIEGLIDVLYRGETNVVEIISIRYYDDEGNLGEEISLSETEFSKYSGMIDEDVKVNSAEGSNVFETIKDFVREVVTDDSGKIIEVIGETTDEVKDKSEKEKRYFGVKIMLNGEYLESDVQPYIINNRTMFPFRACFEMLGAKVDYDFDNPNLKLVWTKLKGSRVDMQIGNTKAVKDGNEIIMDVAPEIYEGRTFVPLRYAAELLGATVEWDQDTKTAIINIK